MNHKCHAHGCDAPCWARQLMCVKHWEMVPREYADAVRANYHPDQVRGIVRPTPAWRAAARRAITAVAYRCGLISQHQARAGYTWADRIERKAHVQVEPDR